MSAEPQTSITRGTRYWALLLLVLAAVPDVLPYPGLKSIVAERFGLEDAGAQLFAIFALLGALGAVPMLRRARQWAPRKVFALGALVQALSISLMILPIDWLLVLLLRCVQGYVAIDALGHLE